MKLLLWAQHWVFNILFHILQQLWLYSNSLFCTLLCNNCLWKCNYNGKSRSYQNIFERFYIFCNVSSASSIWTFSTLKDYESKDDNHLFANITEEQYELLKSLKTERESILQELHTAEQSSKETEVSALRLYFIRLSSVVFLLLWLKCVHSLRKNTMLLLQC